MKAFKVGSRVFWNDPDNENSCSGAGVIVAMNTETLEEDTILSIEKDDGGCVEAYPHECVHE